MSHEVARRFDGKGGAMFTVGDAPWHQSDTNSRVYEIGKGPRTIEEVIEGADFGWTADVVPAYMKDLDDTFLQIANANVVVRSDTRKALAVVGGFYRPLQNRDMVATLQPLVDQGLASWETAGVLQGGRRVWAQVRLNLTSKVIQQAYGKKGEIIPLEIILNTHDGSGKLILAETRQVVVCRNTEIMAMHDIAGRASTQKVRHDQSVEVNTVKAAESLWTDLVDRHEHLARQLIHLRRTRLDDELFRRLVLDVALPKPEQVKQSDLAAKLMATRTEKWEKQRETVTDLWTNGLGQSGEKNCWTALNAVTEACDNDRGVWNPSGNRMNALMPGGSLQKIKQDVTASLLAYANAHGAAVALSA